MKRLTAAITGLILVAGAGVASAHGIWIAERWGEHGLVYGHGAEDGSYDPAKISSVKLIDEDGNELAGSITAHNDYAILEKADDAAIALIDFDNGFYTKDANGKWHNRPKSEFPNAETAGRYIKHTISILHLHGDMPTIAPQDLQIIPLSNPTALEAGSSLKLRVLYKGDPLPGILIIPDYVNMPEQNGATTDDKGMVEVVVRNNGLNVIAAKHSVDLVDDKDADLVQHFATLSFVAGGEHSH
ncbi:MAG: DUF4198 domain-containing protein [Thalassospira sp.]|uniref:DUF4198 domain-containing protein n=1 Tax=Thalassospira sp. TaxID=1912094 RepID=UPI0032EF26C8